MTQRNLIMSGGHNPAALGTVVTLAFNIAAIIKAPDPRAILIFEKRRRATNPRW